eukprot:362502_1
MATVSTYLITIALFFIVTNCCGPWTLATDQNLICDPGQFQYKYQLNSNTYYLSPQTSHLWSWNAYTQANGNYQYTTNGGTSFSSFGCNGGESVGFGVGCSTGGGNKWKVIAAYSQNKNLATATVCQDQPGIFGSSCVANIEIYFRSCPGTCTKSPSYYPTLSPSRVPTDNPSYYPSYYPTLSPSRVPTDNPSYYPSYYPTLSPTYKNCNDEGEIKNIDWDELQNNNDNSAQIPYHDFTINTNQNTLELTIDINLEYVGFSSDGNFDKNYNLGTTYVIDWQSFSVNGDNIDKPGTCQNRLKSSFNDVTDFSRFWGFSEYPYLPDQLSSNSYLSYPPSQYWTLSIDNDVCTPINYNAVFSWKALSECTDFEGNQLIHVVDGDTSISLSGTLYVNLVSPYSMDATDTGIYRTFPLIQQDFEISITKQINVIGSTGIDLFITSIIGVFEDETDQSFELSIFTQTADYMQLTNPMILNTPFGNIASISVVTTSCLTASTYTCGQIFTITVNQTEISCPPADMSGLYDIAFDVECRSNEPVCDTFIADNEGTLIALQVTSNFIDNTCEPEMYQVIFNGLMTFYDDVDFLIAHNENYVIGQDIIYIQVETNIPDDGSGDNFRIFGVEINNVFVCTVDDNTDINSNLDQQNGNGGCLSSNIDPDGPYDIITNGLANSNYMAQIISSTGDSNIVQFSFLTFDVGRTVMYAHVQLTLILQNGNRRRLELSQVANNQLKDNNYIDVSDQIRHFVDSTGIKPLTSTLESTMGGEVDYAKNLSLCLSIFVCFVTFILY